MGIWSLVGMKKILDKPLAAGGGGEKKDKGVGGDLLAKQWDGLREKDNVSKMNRQRKETERGKGCTAVLDTV